jgi:hypothetical protein
MARRIGKNSPQKLYEHKNMIKCMENNLKIIGKIESLLEELKVSLGATPKKHTQVVVKTPKAETIFSGLTGDIYSLVRDGFFKKPKAISEIQNKLQLEGIKKPTTTLSSPLLFLTRKKVLARTKPADGKGPYKYQQR